MCQFSAFRIVFWLYKERFNYHKICKILDRHRNAYGTPRFFNFLFKKDCLEICDIILDNITAISETNKLSLYISLPK